MGEMAEPVAKRRRVWLQDSPEGPLYSAWLEPDAIGDDLRRAATPDFNDRERARVTLRTAGGAVLDLRKPVPADADAFGEGAVVVEVAPAAAPAAAPSVLDQLAGCVVKPAKEQYGKYLDDVHTTLRDRKEALRVLAEAVVRSVEAAASKPRHLVVFAGPSGSGKTRGGYEGSAMWDHVDGRAALEEALKGKSKVADRLCGLRGPDRAPGANVLTLYIDLNNGLQYHSGIDKLDADVRLGARLAAQALDATHNDVGLQDMVRFPPEQLLVAKVLSAILRGQLARRTSTAPPLLLVAHVDEWQLYMAKLVEQQHVDIPAAVGVVKSMFSALNSFAFDPPAEFKGKFVLLPILSGTPVLEGVQLALTERMEPVDGPLPSLSEDAGIALAVELFCAAGFGGDAVRSMLRGSDAARVGLSDTGYWPRLLVQLCDEAVRSAEEKHVLPNPLLSIAWVDCAWKVSERLRKEARRIPDEIPHLVLSGEPVKMVTTGGAAVTDGAAGAVRVADERGVVLVREVETRPGWYVVSLPFMLLRLRCTDVFPEDLLRPLSNEDRWTWEQFERLYAHFTKARLKALLDVVGQPERVVALSDVIKGARGSDGLLAQQVRITGTRQVHWEEKQFMPRKADKPEKVDRVSAALSQGAPQAEIDLNAGVFLAKAGNSLFDMRYTLEAAAADQPAVHVFVQDRHTGADATKVNTQAISEWYTEADAATTKWRAAATDSVALLYFTNRELTDHAALNDSFFRDRPRLLVVTKAELSDALTPAFVGRGLIPQNPRPT